MSHADRPGQEQPDIDALLRAFVDQPVPPMLPLDADALRARVTSRLEGRRGPSLEGQIDRDGRGPGSSSRPRPACPSWPGPSPLTRRGRRGMESAAPARAGITRGRASRDRGGRASHGARGARRARARLPTGAIVEVGPSARLRFEAAGHDAATRDRVGLVAGRIEVQVPKLASGDEVRVQTDEATVVVHGTKFAVERLGGANANTSANTSQRPGETRVTVTEGIVEVDTDQGVRMLTAGMTLRVPEPLADPVPPLPASAPPVSESDPAPAASSASSTLAAENALLTEAMRLRRGRQGERALTLLDGLLARYPASPLTESARVERLRALEETGSTDRLGREAARYLADYPRGFGRAEAERMLAGASAHSP